MPLIKVVSESSTEFKFHTPLVAYTFTEVNCDHICILEIIDKIEHFQASKQLKQLFSECVSYPSYGEKN